MSNTALTVVGQAGAYPERRQRRPSALDRLGARVTDPLVRWARGRSARGERLLPLAAAEGRSVEGLSDRQIRDAAHDVGARLRRDGFREALVARAFALVREVAARRLGERHHDVQLVGGRVLLDGLVAEMETGEGKTLTATLPACTAALAGIPVHLVTVNDYLAGRDAEWMGPIYQALGLSVGVIVEGMPPDARQVAYACDVTYCTNKELAFDYLRDRLIWIRPADRLHLQLERLYGDASRARRLVLRGLHYAIVDEADSVLVDEARTPLIIAGRSDTSAERHLYEQALTLADRLVEGDHFLIERRERQVSLTEVGRVRLRDLAESLGGVWGGRLRREALVCQALSARHLFERDRDYLVSAGGGIRIIDEFTGRVMLDRSWEQGLHQLIEVKENCALTSRNETLARISYQRFFRRYLRLAGMTGTAREIAGELWSVYRLAVVSVPTNRPRRRRAHPDRTYATSEARWKAVLDSVEAVHRRGRPVLLGTRSVAASEDLSARLTRAGLSHRVLNARQDREESEIVALAGQPARITVATNMAGRGTDIRLGPGVAERGGLHVIATERHEARRIDRQLFGRCGRQGDPGTHEAIVSLEDDLIVRYGGIWRPLARALARPDGAVPAWIARATVRRAQRAAERLHRRMRADLLNLDEHLETALAFTGQLE